MPPILQQSNISPELEQLLGHILTQNHMTGITTEQLLGHILSKLNENGQNANQETLLGMSLLKLEEIAKSLNSESKISTVADFVTNFLKVIKGDQGIQGIQGEIGPQGPKGDSIVGPEGKQGLQGQKGDTGSKGERGFAGKDGRNGLDGNAGKDGKDGKDGNPGKDGSPETAKQIIAKIKGVLSYSDLKDAPEFRMGGTRPDSISMAEVIALIDTNRVETPTGTRNGVNKDFTVLHTPKFITLNGQTWYEGAGYSMAGLVATLDIAPNAITDPSPDIIRSHW